MEKLIIGIDLCDNYTQAAVLGREDAWMLPTVICRKKAEINKTVFYNLFYPKLQ